MATNRRRYTKSDVRLHNARMYDPLAPAVNIKAYNLPGLYTIMDAAGIPAEEERAAEERLNTAFEGICESFHEEWTDPAMAREYFPQRRFGPVRIYSAGRSGGWLEVHGLPALESWDAIDLAYWRRFETAVLRDVQYRTSLEYILDEMQAYWPL